ncbi:MAG: T9SS type A sorting domain-containing protein [Candidatus Eiseniibacteriota bacterium]
MLANDYPPDTFYHIDWHTSGALANGSGSARAPYFGVTATPDIYFDGIDNVLGAGDSLSAHAQYAPIMSSHQTDPSHSKAIVSAGLDLNRDTMTGSITVDVEVAPGETITLPANCSIRAALIENDIDSFPGLEPHTGNRIWHHVGRMMIFETTLTITASGEQQQVVQGFAIDPNWNPDNLEAIAWVQRNTNRVTLQAAKATNQYAVEVADLDPLVGKVAGVPADYDVQVTYTGSVPDDVTITVDESALPAGWDAEIEWMATTYPTSLTIPGMTNGQMEAVIIRTIPGVGPAPRAGTGLGTITVETAPVSNTSVAVQQTYHTFSNTPALLFVDDDNGAVFETHFTSALAGSGHSAVTRNVQTLGNPETGDMTDYDAVIWTTGALETQTIGVPAQTSLQTYLDGGGAFFLSSHGYLDHQGITSFTSTYLGVNSFVADGLAASATGVAGDPIGNGLSFALAPPFTDRTDHVTPGFATTWLEGPAGVDIGVRYDSGVFKTVFMSAPFEGVPALDQPILMDRILDWLTGTGAVDAPQVDAAARSELTLWQNTPNPFRSDTEIRFELPRAGVVDLAVFDVGGRRVASLLSGPLGSGRHAATWNGRGVDGSPAASGVYFVRLTTPERTVTRDMLLLK